MKKLAVLLAVTLALGACKAADEYAAPAPAAPAPSEAAPAPVPDAPPVTWTPPPPPKLPSDEQQCLINERSCVEVIDALQQPDPDDLLAAWNLKIADLQTVRTGTRIYTLDNGVKITFPCTLEMCVPVTEVLLEDNTLFAFDQTGQQVPALVLDH